jgi:transposase InsO family protein
MTPEVSQALGQVVNHKRVARLMREHGLQSHKRQRFRVVTTDSKHAHPVAPNQKWLADMTYVATAEGWLYVALVLDLHARKLVGWAMSLGVAPGVDAASAGGGPGLARSGGGPGTPFGPWNSSTRPMTTAANSRRGASRCR